MAKTLTQLKLLGSIGELHLMGSPVRLYWERCVTSSPKVQSLPKIEIEGRLYHIVSQAALSSSESTSAKRKDEYSIMIFCTGNSRAGTLGWGVPCKAVAPGSNWGPGLDRRHSLWKQTPEGPQSHRQAALRALSGGCVPKQKDCALLSWLGHSGSSFKLTHTHRLEKGFLG